MTEFIYRYNSPGRAQVFLSFQLETTSRAEEVAAVLAELERGGMNGLDISDDELAKSHARYMIGGASDVPNERIFRFGATILSSLLLLLLLHIHCTLLPFTIGTLFFVFGLSIYASNDLQFFLTYSLYHVLCT